MQFVVYSAEAASLPGSPIAKQAAALTAAVGFFDGIASHPTLFAPAGAMPALRDEPMAIPSLEECLADFDPVERAAFRAELRREMEASGEAPPLRQIANVVPFRAPRGRYTQI